MIESIQWMEGPPIKPLVRCSLTRFNNECLMRDGENRASEVSSTFST